MVRRLIPAVAVVAYLAASAFAAERATFILTNGERKSGEVVFHGGNAANFIDGQLNLGENGKEQSFPIDQVAVIDFAGGQPATTELSRIPASGQVVALRDGNTIPGKFVNIVRGDTLLWESESGQQQQFAVRDVARVYLNPQSARTAFNYNGPVGAANAVGTTGSLANGRTIQVIANKQWTDTGIDVNAGDRVVFQGSGEITIGRSPGQTASVDGNGSFRSAQYPDPNAPGGALIGKVGNNGKPFGIGSQSQPLPMPASGRLYLGVNDNEIGDNSGAFSVVVAKQ
jgi:hypothetical protein